MTAKKRNRNISLMIWVTPHERELIGQKMALLGTGNLSAYLRKMAIDGYVVKLDLPELKKFAATLRRISNNLNQIARRVNETGHFYEADLEDMRQKQEDCWVGSRTCGLITIRSEEDNALCAVLLRSNGVTLLL